ncbi:MAG: TrmH family RNA methyltransferase [Candidatus Sericytochromatia bacterium]
MLLSSRSNTRIKHIRHLQQRKARQQHRQFVIEGAGLIAEALSAGWVLRCVLQRENQADAELAAAAEESFEVTAELMDFASSLSSPPDALGVFDMQEVDEDPRRRSAWLLTDRLQDPGNFGALLRLADAMNWRGVLALGAYPDPFQSKVVRGSMGSCLRLPVRPVTLEQLDDWQKKGWQLVGTSADSAEESFSFVFPERLLLALGHEGQGLDPALLACCEQRVAIPIRPGVDSLNVVTAAAMLVHEDARQHWRRGS